MNVARTRAFLVCIAALCALVFSSAAHAANGDRWLGLQLGGSIPVGEFGNAAGEGFQGSLMATYSGEERAEVGVDIAYHDWGERPVSDPLITWLLGRDLRPKYRAAMAGLHVTRYSPPLRRVSVYGRGGLGAVLVHARLGRPTDLLYADTKEFGYQFSVGGGISVEITPRQRVGVGALYHIIKADEADAVDFVSLGMSVMWLIGGR